MEYPKELLRDIYWSFSQGAYSSQSEFLDALKTYYKAITGNKLTLNFEDVIFDYPKIVLQYVKYTEDDVEEPQVLLDADNGQNFRLAELLYKANNDVGVNLENDDNCYFEGLTFATEDDPDFPAIPVYFLDTGS